MPAAYHSGFFTGWMPFLVPSVKALKAILVQTSAQIYQLVITDIKQHAIFEIIYYVSKGHKTVLT